MAKFSRIIGTGSYLPEKVLTNKDLEQIVETNDEWIVERTGIKERHIVAEGETTGDMAYHASLKAIEMAGISADEIDVVIVGSSSPDFFFPATACYLQSRLGIKVSKGAFDMQAACSGFMYALTLADSLIKTDMAKNVLVVGADTLSRIVDYTDRNTCVLFGDGAGAAILQASDEVGILGTQMYADGNYTSILNCETRIDNGKIVGHPYLTMDGQAVFKFAVKALSGVAKELADKCGVSLNDIDWVVPHQANIRIIESTARSINAPMDKVVVTVDKHGNTSAASIPLALDLAVRDGRIKRNDLILLEGVGGGFTWGASLIRF